MEVLENNENNTRNVLTCIHAKYTLAGQKDSLENMMVNNFLNTLAEIAIDIVSRETDKQVQ